MVGAILEMAPQLHSQIGRQEIRLQMLSIQPRIRRRLNLLDHD
jgi:hypothetical protein